ncbi:uncharacterized protein LOC108627293 [Ceratina calcarata]|uniref:Uncharacterized protein LOC108627293 n=1 Tax=Ceratina calcarata TaxID=156304 RepID=A0AAJ7WCJ4_9HYME|nr:uncharacterized protein LOC108627293 [Ceratina calcarata]
MIYSSPGKRRQEPITSTSATGRKTYSLDVAQGQDSSVASGSRQVLSDPHPESRSESAVTKLCSRVASITAAFAGVARFKPILDREGDYLLTLAFLCIGLATSDLSPYKPRGWRPNGRRFNPANNRLHAYYGPPGLPAYEPPYSTSQPPIFTTAAAATDPPATTTTSTTTTPRTREPTTTTTTPDTSNPEEDFESNPALAIANSFAFNRPVYIYNTFPFLPGQVLVR